MFDIEPVPAPIPAPAAAAAPDPAADPAVDPAVVIVVVNAMGRRAFISASRLIQGGRSGQCSENAMLWSRKGRLPYDDDEEGLNTESEGIVISCVSPLLTTSMRHDENALIMGSSLAILAAAPLSAFALPYRM